MKSFKFLAPIATTYRNSGTGLLCCLAALGAFCAPVDATTIQDKYGVFSVNFLTSTPVSGALPGFNPALGALEGVAFTFDASAVLLQGSAVASQIRIEDSSGTLLTDISFPQMTGRAQQIEAGSFTVPLADLADFQSAGNADVTLVGFTVCRGSAPTPTGCNGFTGAVGGQVTYSYTPSYTPTSVPEATTLLLVASGVIAISLVMRRREARHLKHSQFGGG
jgi:hypothetical protein